MATSTTNLGLTKPSVNDAADIGVLNSNFDKIDTKCNPALFAPSGIITGDHWANSDDELSSIVSSVYNSMADHTTKFINLRVVGAQFSGYWTVEINRYNATYGNAVAWNFGDTIQAALYNGVWQPFEWHNPPMQLGVEYRTTERWNGKPVYAKAVSCGKGPSGGAVNLPTGLSGNVTFVEANCKAVSDAGWGVFLNQYLSFGEKGSGTATLSISGAGDLSTRNIYLTTKYIKG